MSPSAPVWWCRQCSQRNGTYIFVGILRGSFSYNHGRRRYTFVLWNIDGISALAIRFRACNHDHTQYLLQIRTVEPSSTTPWPSSVEWKPVKVHRSSSRWATIPAWNPRPCDGPLGLDPSYNKTQGNADGGAVQAAQLSDFSVGATNVNNLYSIVNRCCVNKITYIAKIIRPSRAHMSRTRWNPPIVIIPCHKGSTGQAIFVFLSMTLLLLKCHRKWGDWFTLAQQDVTLEGGAKCPSSHLFVPNAPNALFSILNVNLAVME